jgi:hypothetical protein
LILIALVPIHEHSQTLASHAAGLHGVAKIADHVSWS